ANTGAARSASLTIGGESFAVEQQSGNAAPLPFLGSMAQLAEAGDWDTAITVINTGAVSANLRLSFFDNSGSPMTVPLDFPQQTASSGPMLASSIDRTIA